jgi:hypothetical protein
MIIIFSSQYSNFYIAVLYFLFGLDIPSKCAASFMEGEEMHNHFCHCISSVQKETSAIKYLDCYLIAYFQSQMQNNVEFGCVLIFFG